MSKIDSASEAVANFNELANFASFEYVKKITVAKGKSEYAVATKI